MHRLSLILILISGCIMVSMTGNPHGKEFRIECEQCHNPEGWKVNPAQIRYNHAESGFTLEGRHRSIDCRSCHKSLVFSEADSKCLACHQDVHAMTVGDDCGRCHSADNWLVHNIPQLHEESGFALRGVHQVAACADCHKSANTLEWSRIGTDCSDCHLDDYNSAQNPSHVSSGFSTDCTQCHDPLSKSWTGDFVHYFFPLTQGHDNLACVTCHPGNNFTQASPECFSCHQTDYTAAQNPNHQQSGFPTDCAMCHSLAPGWKPASFTSHDAEFFPIYSGKHKGEWNKCSDCHTNLSNLALFSCIDCHEHSNAGDLADEHDDVNGYQFNSQACLDCHPDGRAEDK